jgi:RNA polymerase sigma factor (sigma-70 family)
MAMTSPIDSTVPGGSSEVPDPDEKDRGFSEFYQDNYAKIVKAIEVRGVVREDAEEIAQEAFAKTLLHWNRVKSGNNPTGYTYRVSSRLAWRRSRRRRDVYTPTGSSDQDLNVELGLSVRAAIVALPKRQRECVVLCALLEFTSDEAAQVLEINPATVRSHLHQARITLAEVLHND